MSEAQSNAQDRGRELERAGDLEGAFQLYTSAGLLDDAVRMLVERGRSTDAADVILAMITTRPRPLADADRAWALRCALLFEQGGAVLRAVDVLAWIGAMAAQWLLARRHDRQLAALEAR